ncbi:MAG TPA: polysaccharide biosynthesis tyrosine autokinase [Candidatus Binataceae bacterium]|nr:polysaccharide biosynthesis tyrosine autokinase [Candidatus Binataceae bacterium]
MNQPPSPYFIRRTTSLEEARDIDPRHSFFEEEDEGRIDFHQYWRIVHKHVGLIAAIVAGVTLLTLIHELMQTPMYTAEATILIKRTAPQILGSQVQNGDNSASEGYEYDEYFNTTQYEILKSRSLAESAIKNNGLEKVLLNDDAQGKPSGAQSSRSIVQWLRDSLGLPQAAQQEQPAPRPRSALSDGSGVNPKAVGAYMAALAIKPVPDTNLVDIKFTTPTPELSAELANAHAHAYIRQGIELHSQANEEAQKFLQNKLVDLKEQLQKSEYALNRYRRDQGIVPGLMSLDGKETVVLDRLSDLSKDLTKAQVDRIDLESKVQMAENHQFNALPEMLDDKSLQTLRQEYDGLATEYAGMAKQFKPDYPPLARLQAKKDELQSDIDAEEERVAGSIESEYKEAQERENRLQEEMDKSRTHAMGLNDAAVEYAILQREVDTNRDLYNSVLQRMKDVGLASEARSSNVVIVDTAEVPHLRSSPLIKQSVLTAAVLSLVGGIGLAFMLEFFNNRIKTPEEIEQYLKMPSLAVVPEFGALPPNKTAASSLSLDRVRRLAIGSSALAREGHTKDLVGALNPYSMHGEAYRTLRTGILLSRAGSPPKVILLTSTTSGEGKTATATNSAVLFAHTGAKVLLIDADLRKPRCHRVFNVDKEVGLTEALTGRRDIHEVIRTTHVDGLSLLTSGSLPPNPTELLGSEKMRQILAQLAEEYDFVIIDSPPVLPVSDSIILSTLVDGVVVVVSSVGTAKQQVRIACSRLRYARAKIFGAVLNKVNLQSPEYKYYSSYYYQYSNEILEGSPDVESRKSGGSADSL